jgi:hypothetical protein
LLSRRGAVEPAFAFILSSTARDRDLAHACIHGRCAGLEGWNLPEQAGGRHSPLPSPDTRGTHATHAVVRTLLSLFFAKSSLRNPHGHTEICMQSTMLVTVAVLAAVIL